MSHTGSVPYIRQEASAEYDWARLMERMSGGRKRSTTESHIFCVTFSFRLETFHTECSARVAPVLFVNSICDDLKSERPSCAESSQGWRAGLQKTLCIHPGVPAVLDGTWGLQSASVTSRPTYSRAAARHPLSEDGNVLLGLYCRQCTDKRWRLAVQDRAAHLKLDVHIVLRRTRTKQMPHAG